MYGSGNLDNFKTGVKETGDNRNVVPTENATYLMDCKLYMIKRSWCDNITHD